MKYIFTKKNIDNLVMGDLFFGTGGGLPEKISKIVYEEAFKISPEIEVFDIEEFNSEDYIFSAYGVGDPAKATTVSPDFIKNVIENYKKLTSIKPKGVILGEVSAGSLAFLIAAILKLPIVNSDLVGGRAAPEIYMDCFGIYNKPIVPVLAMTMDNKNILLNGPFSSIDVEKIVRSFFANNGSRGVIAGYPIKASEYAKIGMLGTITKTEKDGELLNNKKIDEFLIKNNGKILAEGKITKIELDTKNAFTQGYIIIGDYKVEIKNENMKVLLNNNIIVKAPQVIAILSEDFRPIHNSIINDFLDKEVKLCVLESVGYWKDKKNANIWNND